VVVVMMTMMVVAAVMIAKAKDKNQDNTAAPALPPDSAAPLQQLLQLPNPLPQFAAVDI